MVLLNLVFLSIFSLKVFATDTDNLVALVQIFRHGQRTPIRLYPNDPHKTHWKDEELEQLTNKGRRQMHTLGQLTRTRYSNWIPLNYKNFIIAQTTDVDRTHVSGQTYLYGLFPATGNQKWLLNSDWQAIPLHPANPKILWVDSSSCPAYEPLYEKLLSSEDFIKINKHNADLYAYLTNHTGETINDLHSAELICDTLQIEQQIGLKLPEWTKTVYPEPLSAVYGMWLKSLTYTTQLKRLYAGSLLNEILDFFDAMAINSTLSPKLRVYSGHDDNIASILNTVGSFEPPYMLEFGSTLWIELRNHNNTNYVNLWLKNVEDLTQIQIRGCKLDCPLEQVKIILKDILVDVETWTKECNSSDKKSSVK